MTEVSSVIGDDNVIDEAKKKKVTTPPILDKAAEAASNLNLGDADPADRQRTFEYRAKPALDLFEKQKQATNKYFEAQGLRFSSERREDLLDLTERTFKHIGESVMVPQIEREQVDRRANIATATQVGAEQFRQQMASAQLALQQGQLSLQERRTALDEVNAALDRAVAQGRETGSFVDPVTGEQYRTLAAQAQEFGEGIEERRTTVLEMDSAMQRAVARGNSTGTFIDPVTGLSQETITGRQQALNERVQRALAIGKWIEDDVEIDAIAILAALGIDLEELLGAPGPTPVQVKTPSGDDRTADEAPPGGKTGGGDVRTADDVKDEILETDREIQFLSTIPDWTERLGGAPANSLQVVVAELGVDDAQALFKRLETGERIPMPDLLRLIQSDEQDGQYNLNVFFALEDFLVAETIDGVVHVVAPGSIEVATAQKTTITAKDLPTDPTPYHEIIGRDIAKDEIRQKYGFTPTDEQIDAILKGGSIEVATAQKTTITAKDLPTDPTPYHEIIGRDIAKDEIRQKYGFTPTDEQIDKILKGGSIEVATAQKTTITAKDLPTDPTPYHEIIGRDIAKDEIRQKYGFTPTDEQIDKILKGGSIEVYV